MSANGGPYKVPVGLHPDFPHRGRLGDHARLVSYLQRLAAAFGRRGQCWVTVTGLDGRPIGGALCFTNAGQALVLSNGVENLAGQYQPRCIPRPKAYNRPSPPGMTDLDRGRPERILLC